MAAISSREGGKVNLISLYLTKTVILYTMLVLLALLGLYTLIDFIAELEDIGKGQYRLADILLYTLLSIPKRLYDLLPIAALIGSVLGLGQLSSQSELIVMRATGMSVTQINKAVAKAAIFLMLIAVFIGEVVRPITEKKARHQKSVAQMGVKDAQAAYGFWSRDGLHFHHIREIHADGRLSGITIYQFDADLRLEEMLTAESATYTDKTWILSTVMRRQISETGVITATAQLQRWYSQLTPEVINIVTVPAEFLTILGLNDYIQHLEKNHQAVASYQMAFWMKVMMPLSTAVMVFLAVPFVFGNLRSVSNGGRIVVASLVGIGFYLLSQIVQHLSLVYELTPWMAATLPVTIFALIGYRGVRQLDKFH